MASLFRVTCFHSRKLRLLNGIALFCASSALLYCQNQIPTAAVVKGVVRDSQGHVVGNVAVSLHTNLKSPPITTQTDSRGFYSFASLAEGSYSLNVESSGKDTSQFGPFALQSHEVKTIDLTLVPAANAAAMTEFFDQPQFTVAGVNQAGNAGGHGSDVMQRTSDALAKATVSLSIPSLSSASTTDLQHARDDVRAQLTHDDKAELHHRLANIEEKLGNPLEAVREYQRAAEMEPSEPYLFDWGAELLAHRALDPAAEVFARGHRLFPKSERMLIGLGAAFYARGSYDKAQQSLFEASDLDPTDSTPYLFLGKMQAVETVDSKGFAEKFARFVALQPKNALANYYYAVSLWKQSRSGNTDKGPEQITRLLEKAIRLDPKLGAAYLQLGIISSEKGNLQSAIAEYQKALESDPDLLEAHYRLGQAYRRAGQNEKAQRELRLYDELSKKRSEQAERERQEIQQFVITLRNGTKE